MRQEAPNQKRHPPLPVNTICILRYRDGILNLAFTSSRNRARYPKLLLWKMHILPLLPALRRPFASSILARLSEPIEPFPSSLLGRTLLQALRRSPPRTQGCGLPPPLQQPLRISERVRARLGLCPQPTQEAWPARCVGFPCQGRIPGPGKRSRGAQYQHRDVPQNDRVDGAPAGFN